MTRRACAAANSSPLGKAFPHQRAPRSIKGLPLRSQKAECHRRAFLIVNVLIRFRLALKYVCSDPLEHTMAYTWDNAMEEGRRRLALLEASLDPGTFRRLEAIGVREGW